MQGVHAIFFRKSDIHRAYSFLPKYFINVYDLYKYHLHPFKIVTLE